MFGIVLVAISSFTDEAGTSLGKREVAHSAESIYTMGFLNSLWGTLFLLILAFLVPKGLFTAGFPSGFMFNMASLPTFLPRVALEVLQAWATMYAIVRADRSTYGFLRTITIPLLLVADVALGYGVSIPQIIGMGLIITSFILLFMNHGIRRAGMGFVIFTAINAVITISLYKYDITHFNSIEAEQSLVSIVLLVFFFVMAFVRAGENPFRLLAKPYLLAQSVFFGISSILSSFAYLFGAASVITTAMRAFSILFSMLAGHVYFREKKFWLKFFAFALITAGLVFLAK